MKQVKNIAQIIGSLWIIYIFAGSLPYKFSGHEHTQFIFGTIGDWMSGIFGNTIGQGFGNYGAYVIGAGELVISLLLLAAIVMSFMKKQTGHLFGFAGLGAMILMIGAAFFHLATPLGIEVNGDGGSLFRAAVSIIVIGALLAINNCAAIKAKICK